MRKTTCGFTTGRFGGAVKHTTTRTTRTLSRANPRRNGSRTTPQTRQRQSRSFSGSLPRKEAKYSQTLKTLDVLDEDDRAAGERIDEQTHDPPGFQAHDERKQGELSEQRLAEIWVEVQKDVLGPAVVVDENSAYIWSQVGHFFFLPFYVYAYSFADCLVNSLYQVSQENRVENFPAQYLDMLSKTAITEYDELLAPFGLNPSDTAFWNKGLSLISGYIDELERLDKKLGL